jgi:HSP20 family protein
MFALKPVTKRTMAPLPRAEVPFNFLPTEFANLFHRFFTDWPVLETPEWPYRWAMTTEELEKELIVRVELPGFLPEEVKVELKGDELLVEAEHKVPAEKVEKEEKVERTYAHVKRVLTLPPAVELEKAEAIYRNGVLEVHLPRKAEAMGRRIEVKT